jgi:hypothetical protein
LYQNEKCSDQPFWGIVFVWWAFAAFLMGAATTTGFNVVKDIFKDLWMLSCGKGSRKQDVAIAPSEQQVIKVE